MKYYLTASIAVFLMGTSVYAQPQIGSYRAPVTNPRPHVSPYLNIGRGGVSGAIDYFGIVKPQMESQSAIQQLQQQFQMTQGQFGQGQQQIQEQAAISTGRTMGGFFNYSHFYPGFNRGGAISGMRR